MIYLDSAATSFRKPPAVREAVLRAMEVCATPGRGGHAAAMAAAETVYSCRSLAAELFDCRVEQVVFTNNATHGLNLAIKSLVGPGDRVVISGFEHNAVTRPLHALGARVTVACGDLFDREAVLRGFREAVTPGTKAVICTHASNVFGFILPIEEIAALCRVRGVPLVIDASQSAGILPLSLRRLGAAYLAMPGHKALYGPQGTGLLLCGKTPERTLLEGGTGSLSREQTMPPELPDRLEPGTPNVPGIAGLAAGLSFVKELGTENVFLHETTLLRGLVSELEAEKRAELFTGNAQLGVLSLRISGHDCEEVGAALSERGIAVRAGLHCAPLAHRSAGTLETGTVRVSLSCFTTDGELRELVRALHTI